MQRIHARKPACGVPELLQYIITRYLYLILLSRSNMRFSSASIASLLSTAVLSVNHQINYDCSKTPQLCFNTCWALNVVGHPQVLHGSGGSGAGSDNREDWGYKKGMCNKQSATWQCPDGYGNMVDCKSIDEYPFASSWEGGFAFQSIVVALRCIPSNDQNSKKRSLTSRGTLD